VFVSFSPQPRRSLVYRILGIHVEPAAKFEIDANGLNRAADCGDDVHW
jgi:hypothetical protein